MAQIDVRVFIRRYSNGELRVVDYISKSVTATFRGHRAGISCLNYCETVVGSSAVQAAVSGGKDCDIIVWDLVAGHAIARLRGHKDIVTAVDSFTVPSEMSGSRHYLVSVSKDCLMKVG